MSSTSKHLRPFAFLAVALQLLQPVAASATQTTWGAIKAQYRNSQHLDSGNGTRLQDGPMEMDPGEGPSYSGSGGDSYNLPTGCSVTESQLLTWARSMPAVQLAMSTLAARGYTARPADDRAVRWCSPPTVGSSVVLAYERPVTVLEDLKLGAGAIIITSVLNQATGEPVTKISGGMIIIDHSAQLVFAADSLAQYRATDPSFDIEVDGGDGNPDPGVIRPGLATVVPGDEVNFDSRFHRVLKCTGGSTFICSAGIMTGIYLGGPGAWAVAVAAGGWGIAAIAVGCLGASYIGCQMMN